MSATYGYSMQMSLLYWLCMEPDDDALGRQRVYQHGCHLLKVKRPNVVRIVERRVGFC